MSIFKPKVKKISYNKKSIICFINMMKKNMVDLVYKKHGSEGFKRYKKRIKFSKRNKNGIRPSNKLFWRNFRKNPGNTALTMIGITFSK